MKLSSLFFAFTPLFILSQNVWSQELNLEKLNQCALMTSRPGESKIEWDTNTKTAFFETHDGLIAINNFGAFKVEFPSDAKPALGTPGATVRDLRVLIPVSNTEDRQLRVNIFYSPSSSSPLYSFKTHWDEDVKLVSLRDNRNDQFYGQVAANLLKIDLERAPKTTYLVNHLRFCEGTGDAELEKYVTSDFKISDSMSQDISERSISSEKDSNAYISSKKSASAVQQ